MHDYQPYSVIGFHSCDREIGLRVLNGADDLAPSTNRWDWLGQGIYFWEQNPQRALDYALESAAGSQYNRRRIKTPFVLGAIIELGNCLNLIESGSLNILTNAHKGLLQVLAEAGDPVPVNIGAKRMLDCAVVEYIHQSNRVKNEPAYDTVRCAFPEADEAYPGAMITSRLHIQVCVRNPDCIKGYFLPQPVDRYNPHLRPGDYKGW